MGNYRNEVEMIGYSRPGWDEYFLNVAKAISMRGDCTRSRVGAVIVNWEKRIISTGYNGTLPGIKGCLEGNCARGRLDYSQLPAYSDYGNCDATHAEANAISFLDSGEGLTFPFGLTMYVTREPCADCYSLIRHFGITRVCY